MFLWVKYVGDMMTTTKPNIKDKAGNNKALSCLIILVFALAVIFGTGIPIGNWMYRTQQASCAFIEAGLDQFSGQKSENPQTEQACLQALEAGRPFLRLWGLLVGFFIFAGIVMLLLVGSFFLGGKNKNTTEEEPDEPEPEKTVNLE